MRGLELSYFNDKPSYNTSSVKETLEHSPAPKITQTNIYSMNPDGLYGSVYEDPRGTNILKIGIVVFVVIGIIVTGILGYRLYHNILASKELPDSVKSLSSQVLNIPVLTNYADMDDDTLFSTIAQSFSVYQTSIDADGMTLVRLPDGVDSATLAIYNANGYDSLTTDQLATVLKTAWFFSTDRTSQNTIKVKYADFVSGSIDSSITNAVNQQGLKNANSVLLTKGTDENENTYEYGSVTLESGTYYWRVSACPLSDVYYNSDMPTNAVYTVVTLSDTGFMTVQSENTSASTTTSS